MLQKIKSDRICATCCGYKILLQDHNISPVHTKRFVAVMCRRNVLLQLVAEPEYTEWSVTATCCCNVSPSVYRPFKSLLCTAISDTWMGI